MSRLAMACVLVLSGCAGATASPDPHPVAVPAPADPPARELDEVTGALRAARVVCFGERHDSAADHVLEAALVRALFTDGGGGVVGLEMVERPRQSVLDRFDDGELTLEALAAELSWATTWGHDFAMYAPVFDAARRSGASLRALNARREVVRAVAREGVAAARTRYGDELPPVVLADDYRAFVAAALAGHSGMEGGQLERFVAAQRVWDETMARTAHEALTAGAPRVLVLAGAMHCAGGYGVPSALRALGVSSVVSVLGEGAEVPRLDGRPVADYVLRAIAP